VIQVLLAFTEKDKFGARFSLNAIQKALIKDGHLNPVHSKTGKQIPLIYQIVSETPIRLSNVTKLDYSLSGPQNIVRMENKRWFSMSIFELLEKREEAKSGGLKESVEHERLISINVFR